MLYGKVIFIKKTGEDGSKFPVTSKSVKIGRSEDCIIRIQNPLVSPEQCQLIVDDDGQARIKNLSRTNPTILNDKPLGMGELVLRQGDVFKLGERLARWEYLPSSKYYHQQAHGSERLVAVIAPQKRISETSTANEIVKMKVASKRRFSEKPLPTGRGTVSKILRLSLGSAKGVSNRTKLVPRHSLQLKNLTSSLQVKLRRSAAFESAGSPKIGSACKKNSRRSQTWEVNSLSPPEKSKLVSETGSNRKSTPIKMPISSSGIKSTVKSASKIPSLLTIAEFSPPPPKVMIERMAVEEVAEHSILTSPKSPLNNIKTPSPKKIRLSTSRKSLTKSGKKSFSKTVELEEVQPEENTPSNKTLLRKSILKKTVSLSETLDDTPKKTPKNEQKKSFHVEISPLENIGGSSVKSTKQPPVRSQKSTPKRVSLLPTSTPKYSEWSRGKKSIPSGILTTPKEKENAKGSPRTKAASSNKKPNTPAKKTPQKRGIKRKFSAVASAEMAAKKLKTIAPTKPDKNKKAALLVLGKASGKFRPIPNTNVVIKQKIVKKAIKQSTKRKPAASVKTKAKTPKRKSTKPSKTTSDSSPDFSSKTKRQSTPIKQSPPKESSTRKSEGSKSTVDTVENFKVESPQKRDKVAVTPLSETLPSSTPSKDNKNINFSSFQYQSSDILYNASRRASKRLNSQNFSQQEFTELSPTALGLAPRSVIEVFRTPKHVSRRSSSLVTPKNKETSGIVKSASTSKISRKSVRFSNKDSSFTDLNSNNGSGFDFSEICTPDVTIDRFVSPMTDRKSSNSSCKTPSSMAKTLLEDLESLPKTQTIKSPRSPKIPKLEVNKQNKKKSVENQTKQSPQSKKVMKTPKNSSNKGNDVSSPETGRRKSPRNDATNVKSVSRGLKTVKPPKSPKSDLTDVRGVKRLLATPKPQKSPKNDLTDVGGVKKLMASPRQQKSPKNDLSDVRGVKKLMASPKPQKSPKNDLTDVRGVKKLMTSPKPQKSPKNDLTDVRGVKKLLATPKPQKSPKNDLTDVGGVKKLMASPRQQKSPKNDLSDVRGVKKLMASPKPQKSPKNDLTDVRGVKKLMTSPKPQKSPKNDLRDVRGVRRLMESPKPRKSPRNDLTDVTGLKQLLITAEKDAALKSSSNKIQCLRTLYNVSKSPKNDLSDVAGVRELFSKNAVASNLDASLTGVAELFLSPKEDLSRKRMRDSDVDKKSTIRMGRSATKTAKLVEKKAKMTLQNPEGKSEDEQSPKTARAVRMKAAKTDLSPELKGTRTRFEREAKTKMEKVAEEEQIVTGRTTRAASRTGDRKQAVKKLAAPIESPTPMKKTRQTVSVVDEKCEEFVSTTKAKKANFKEVTATESKPSPIRTRRKSIARVSPKVSKRSTRAKASKTTEDDDTNASKTKSAAKTVVSPIKTRQRKAKEIAPKKKTESKVSPVKTRRRAAK